MPKDSLTELEGAVLGVIWSRGPLTAYGVRRRFLDSPTRGWSSSRGAIYPAIERLIAYGFVAATADATGRRASRKLQITAAGETSLRFWISSLEEWMGGPPVDPVRTRVNYIEALAPAERAAFLDRAERNAQLALSAIGGHEADHSAHHRAGLAAGLLGAQMDVEARLEWIARVRRKLTGGGRTKGADNVR